MPAPSASSTAAWVLSLGGGVALSTFVMGFWGNEQVNHVHQNMTEHDNEHARMMADYLAGLTSTGINLGGLLIGTMGTRFLLWVGNFGLSACKISPCPTGCPGSVPDEERRPLVP